MQMNSSILYLAAAMASGILIPLCFLLYYKKKYGCHVKSFLEGCVVMLVFTFILEKGIHALAEKSAFGEYLEARPLLYTLFAALLACVLEEAGRLLACSITLRHEPEEDDHEALMHGAGHGGFAVIVILFLANARHAVVSLETALAEASHHVLFDIAGQFFAVVLQIALTVLVWFSVKKKKAGLFWLAFFIHFLIEAVLVRLELSGCSELLFLAVSALLTLCAALISFLVFRKNHTAAD